MPASPGLQYGEVAVNLADTVVLPGDPKRLALIISNPGAGTVWIAWGQTAVPNQSIALPPNSPPLVLSGFDWPGLLELDLHAVAAGVPGRLAGLSRLLRVSS